MIVEFKEGERKRTIHKMNITYAMCNFILKFGTIEISKQNYKIIDSHLNNLDMSSYVADVGYYDVEILPDAIIVPDAEIYVQRV